MLELVIETLLIVGVVFFIIGTIGLFRFKSTRAKLHALAKVDNLALGCFALAMVLFSNSWIDIFKIAVIWLLALLSSSIIAYTLAKREL